MYYIITFRSRTNAIRFYDALEREGIEAALINTPRAARAGCGLSIKIRERLIDDVKRVLSYSSYDYIIFKQENGSYYEIRSY